MRIKKFNPRGFLLVLAGRSPTISLLIGVLHKSLVFLDQSRHHALIRFVHRGLDILRSLRGGVDGLVDGEAQPVPRQPAPVAHAGHHVEGAIDCQRTDRQLEFVGQHERTSSEHAHVAREGSCSLGKHHQRHALLEHLACLVVGLADLARAALIDVDVVGCLASLAHEGYLAQSLFHHPLEVAAQEAVDDEDVKRSLVVADKDVALVLAQMFPSFHFDGKQADPDDEPSPPFAGVVAPVVSVAQRASDCRHQRTGDGTEDEEGQDHKELINPVNEFHVVCVF